jgi:hypothetical protein
MRLNNEEPPLAVYWLGPFGICRQLKINIVITIINLVSFHHVSLENEGSTPIQNVILEQVGKLCFDSFLEIRIKQ